MAIFRERLRLRFPIFSADVYRFKIHHWAISSAKKLSSKSENAKANANVNGSSMDFYDYFVIGNDRVMCVYSPTLESAVIWPPQTFVTISYTRESPRPVPEPVGLVV